MNEGMDEKLNVCTEFGAHTNVGEDGGHGVGSGLVAGQAAIHAVILFLHVSNNQRAIRGHPVPERHETNHEVLFMEVYNSKNCM